MIFLQTEHKKQAEKLIEDVKDIIVGTEDLKTMLELIDSIRKLGLTCHFEEEVKKALDTIASTHNNEIYPILGEDLYLTSLYFRLLRQYGYHVSQGILHISGNPFFFFKKIGWRKTLILELNIVTN